jgi:hypothetical protein
VVLLRDPSSQSRFYQWMLQLSPSFPITCGGIPHRSRRLRFADPFSALG